MVTALSERHVHLAAAGHETCLLERGREWWLSLLDTDCRLRHSGLMAKGESESIVPVERIAAQIFVMRGLSVMLDSDLAELYGVTTGNLNLAVRRN